MPQGRVPTKAMVTPLRQRQVTLTCSAGPRGSRGLVEAARSRSPDPGSQERLQPKAGSPAGESAWTFLCVCRGCNARSTDRDPCSPGAPRVWAYCAEDQDRRPRGTCCKYCHRVQSALFASTHWSALAKKLATEWGSATWMLFYRELDRSTRRLMNGSERSRFSDSPPDVIDKPDLGLIRGIHNPHLEMNQLPINTYMRSFLAREVAGKFRFAGHTIWAVDGPVSVLVPVGDVADLLGRAGPMRALPPPPSYGTGPDVGPDLQPRSLEEELGELMGDMDTSDGEGAAKRGRGKRAAGRGASTKRSRSRSRSCSRSSLSRRTARRTGAKSAKTIIGYAKVCMNRAAAFFRMYQSLPLSSSVLPGVLKSAVQKATAAARSKLDTVNQIRRELDKAAPPTSEEARKVLQKLPGS